MNLRDWRVSKGLTQENVGKLIGVGGVTVCRYENGERIPPREIMEQIIKLTKGEVTPNDFFVFPKHMPNSVY